MIIWSGWGILVLVFFVVGLFIGLPVGELISSDPDTSMAVAIVVSGLVAGLGSFLLAKKIESGEGRAFIDEATQQRIVVRKSAGSLFFIPTRWWAYAAPIVGILFAVLLMMPSDPAGPEEMTVAAPADAPQAPVA